MATRYDVEYYLNFQAKRIASMIQYKAHEMKLDNDLLTKEVHRRVREDKDNYTDTYGTQGFIKWFTIQLHKVCIFLKSNPSIYNQTKQVVMSPMEVISQMPLNRNPPPVPKKEVEKPKSKVCTQCGLDKPIDEYYNSKAAKDGKVTACKPCFNNKYSKKKPGETEQEIAKKQIEALIDISTRLEAPGTYTKILTTEQLDMLLAKPREDRDKAKNQWEEAEVYLTAYQKKAEQQKEEFYKWDTLITIIEKQNEQKEKTKQD